MSPSGPQQKSTQRRHLQNITTISKYDIVLPQWAFAHQDAEQSLNKVQLERRNSTSGLANKFIAWRIFHGGPRSILRSM
jgi:hypothetical protein